MPRPGGWSDCSLLPAAEEYLSFAFEHCHRSSQKNKRMILIYLLPVKMLLVSAAPAAPGLAGLRRGRARPASPASKAPPVLVSPGGDLAQRSR